MYVHEIPKTLFTPKFIYLLTLFQSYSTFTMVISIDAQYLLESISHQYQLVLENQLQTLFPVIEICLYRYVHVNNLQKIKY